MLINNVTCSFIFEEAPYALCAWLSGSQVRNLPISHTKGKEKNALKLDLKIHKKKKKKKKNQALHETRLLGKYYLNIFPSKLPSFYANTSVCT